MHYHRTGKEDGTSLTNEARNHKSDICHTKCASIIRLKYKHDYAQIKRHANTQVYWKSILSAQPFHGASHQSTNITGLQCEKNIFESVTSL